MAPHIMVGPRTIVVVNSTAPFSEIVDFMANTGTAARSELLTGRYQFIRFTAKIDVFSRWVCP